MNGYDAWLAPNKKKEDETMPMSGKIRMDDEGVYYEDPDGHPYMLCPMKGGKWRVYEDGTYYTANSGQTMVKGKVMRDVDGSMFTFKSQADAEAWIDDGCKVTLDF